MVIMFQTINFLTTTEQILFSCKLHCLLRNIINIQINIVTLQGAKNLYTSEHIIQEFLKQPLLPSSPNKRIVLIFHCEFSSERGPKLSRFLRSQDRTLNKECYPHLHYPEIYLLEGGYKVFYENEKVRHSVVLLTFLPSYLG